MEVGGTRVESYLSTLEKNQSIWKAPNSDDSALQENCGLGSFSQLVKDEESTPRLLELGSSASSLIRINSVSPKEMKFGNLRKEIV